MATIDLGKIKINWRGTYNNGTAYAIDDAVEYADGGVTSSFICTAASTGNAPSTGGTVHGSWDYLAKGAAGSPTTTRGDIIYRGASADERLAKGSNGQYLQMGSDDPAWVTLSTSPTTTQGDIIYRGSSADARLAKGTAGQVLTMNSGATAPEWAAAAAGGELRGWFTYSSTSNSTTTTVNSFQDSNFTSSNYAPTAADSKLLITLSAKLCNHEGYGTYSSDHRYRLMFRVQREIGGNGTWNTVGHTYGHDAAGGGNIWSFDVRHEEGGGGIIHARHGYSTVLITDTPSTTSNVRYKIQYCAGLSGMNVGISTGGPTYIQILEVAP